MSCQVVLIDVDPINNEINRILFEKILGSDEVAILTNGDDALSYVQACSSKYHAFPKYFFIDIRMPGMDGFEFIEKLTKKYVLPTDIILILLTTSTHVQDRKRAAQLGVDHYVEKPLTLSKLKKILFS